MTVQTAALSKLFIGPVAGANVDTQGEFEALSYVEVAEIENMGTFGDKANIINFTALANRRVRKFKGSYDAGTMELTLGRDPSDSGQAACRAALATDFDYAIKVTLNDQGSGSPQHPTTFYFRAKITSYTTEVGTVENIVKTSVGVAINSAVIEVAAV